MPNYITLLVLNAGLVTLGANFYGAQAQESRQSFQNLTPIAAATSNLLTPEILRNGTYHIPDLGSVTLTNGTYQEESVSVTMSNLFAFGDLNGDRLDDAAILIQVNQNSGTFAYLAAVIAQDSDFENVDTLFVCDWQEVNAVSLNAGQISVEMVKPNALKLLCCPTEKTVQTYRLDADINRLTGIDLEQKPPLEEAEIEFQ